MEQADEEENQKLFQSKVKQKKKASQAITKSVVNSTTGATAKQQKRKWVTDKAADRRTVFVGNLPVSCTVQVRGWVLSAKGMKGVVAVLSLRGCFQLRSHTHLIGTAFGDLGNGACS